MGLAEENIFYREMRHFVELQRPFQDLLSACLTGGYVCSSDRAGYSRGAVAVTVMACRTMEQQSSLQILLARHTKANTCTVSAGCFVDPPKVATISGANSTLSNGTFSRFSLSLRNSSCLFTALEEGTDKNDSEADCVQ